jgi:hypothetical protein
MATNQNTKRRSMDAVLHPETQAHMRLLRGAAPAKSGATPTPQPSGLSLHHIKRMAMNAIAHVETVAQVGVVRLGVGAAVYAAHIRQVDREPKRQAQRQTFPRPFDKAEHTYGRE